MIDFDPISAQAARIAVDRGVYGTKEHARIEEQMRSGQPVITDPVPAHNEDEDEFTPTTEQVRHAFIMESDEDGASIDFDRWLSSLLATAHADGARDALNAAVERVDQMALLGKLRVRDELLDILAARTVVPLTTEESPDA